MEIFANNNIIIFIRLGCRSHTKRNDREIPSIKHYRLQLPLNAVKTQQGRLFGVALAVYLSANKIVDY